MFSLFQFKIAEKLTAHSFKIKLILEERSNFPFYFFKLRKGFPNSLFHHSPQQLSVFYKKSVKDLLSFTDRLSPCGQGWTIEQEEGGLCF